MMVDGQVRTQDVTDLRLLDALQDVPRERFVPPSLADLAYLDRDLKLDTEGRPRALLKAAVLARLIQAAEITEVDHVLDVGCATGYSTAVLARLARSVVGLEEDEALAKRAEKNLVELGVGNATVHRGALNAGAPSSAPYDAIIVEGTIEMLPDALHAQLKDGGRLICIERQGKGPVSRANIYRSSAGDVSGYALFDAAAPLLPGFERPAEFVF